MNSVSGLTNLVAQLVYVGQAAIAIWGTYCVVTVWRRISATRFRNEAEQAEFVSRIEGNLGSRDYEAARAMCRDDPRALSQLVLLAISNRKHTLDRIRQLVVERFQQDVLTDIEYRLGWVNTVIRSSPMLGLFGTVIGMMGAFATLGSSEKVEASALASDIYVALITTAVGLAIAIPLIICMASINIRLHQLESLVESGLRRILEALSSPAEEPPAVRKPPVAKGSLAP